MRAGLLLTISCNSSGFGAWRSVVVCTEALRSDHRRRKRLHGSGCTTAKAVLEELMSTMKCTYPTLQDGSALLCHSCELRLTNIRKAETKISDMKGFSEID